MGYSSDRRAEGHNAQSNEACFMHSVQSARLWALKAVHFLSRVGEEISK
jgi:hypothetical protein